MGECFAGRASWFLPSGHFLATHAGVDAPTVDTPESGEGLGIERCSLPKSIPPEMFEPRRRQFRITDRVLDVLMSEIRLKGAGVVPLGG